MIFVNGHLAIVRQSDALIWDVSTGKCVRTLNRVGANQVLWSHDGSRLLCSMCGQTFVWDVEKSVRISDLLADQEYVIAMAWSHDDAWICGGTDNRVMVWHFIEGLTK